MTTGIAANRRQRKTVLLAAVMGLLVVAGLAGPSAAQNLPSNLPADSSQLLQQYLQNQQPGAPTNTTSPVDTSRNQTTNTQNNQNNQQKPNLNGLDQFNQQAVQAQLLSDRLKQLQLQKKIDKQNYCSGNKPLDDNARAQVEAELSSTEKDYCLRSHEYLEQFGYDFFENANNNNAPFNGAVSDSYQLGIGDQIIAIFHGTNSQSVVTQVDRDGQVILPNMKPIPAAGRTFGDFKKDVQARVASELLGTDVYVSLGQVKSIGVVVAGEVQQPGRHQLTSMTTVLDALVAAGGVKKTGSLRHVRLLRGSKVINVDLYDLFLGKSSANVTLQEGDQIVVPVIGPTIALTGDIKRRGIYELAKAKPPLPMRDALELGGGTLRPSGFRILVSRFDLAGTQTVSEVNIGQAHAHPGDLINVLRTQDNLVGAVRLNGHVTVPGMRSLAAAPTLRDLLGRTDVFKSDPYLLFGILETTDPDTHARNLKAVDLRRVLDGTENVTLHDKDRITVLGADDISFLVSQTVRQVVNTGEYKGNCTGLQHLSRLVTDTRSDRFVAVIRSVILEGAKAEPTDATCPKVYDVNPDILSFVLEHVISVNGEVQNPGVYPVTDGTDMQSIVAVAGGLTNRADRTKVEFMRSVKNADKGTSTLQRQMLNIAKVDDASVLVDPGSIIRFNSLLSDQERGAVELDGEFVRPGLYTITKGERLSEVIKRAGGLTPQAYPYAAVFTRQSVKQAQEAGFKRSARELTNALTSAVLAGEVDPSALGAVRDIAVQLQQTEAVGRMVVEADPAVLRVRKDLDTVLQPGDRIIMPKRPNFVSVVGDVLNPGSLQFTPGKSVKEYLTEAGGLQKSADKKRVFIVYPNGAAEPAPIGAWSFSTTLVPPGSTIVAPKNATPVNFLKLATSLTQIMSQLAVSAASLAVITK